MTRAALFWAGLALMPAGAWAQDHPVVQPTRDVAVTYRLEGAAADVLPGGVPGEPTGPLRLFWDAAGHRMRVEAEGRSQTLLVDLRAPRALVVDSGLRSALALPVRDADLRVLTMSGVTMTRQGQDTVAGLPCTTWAVHDRRGNGVVCWTADGVPLRAAGEVDGRRGSFTATTVSYAPQPGALFAVPAGYMSLSIPSFGRPR